MQHQRTHNAQQDPKEFADSMRNADEVREHLSHLNAGIVDQKNHTHSMADSQTSWFQIKQNIKMLMTEETFQPTAGTFETFGHATYQNIRYEKQLKLADEAMAGLVAMKRALLAKLAELDPDAPELAPKAQPSQPDGPHADDRVRKNQYPDD